MPARRQPAFAPQRIPAAERQAAKPKRQIDQSVKVLPRLTEARFMAQVVELARLNKWEVWHPDQIGECAKIEARRCAGGAGNTPARDTWRDSPDAASAYHAPPCGARPLPAVRSDLQAQASRSRARQGAVLFTLVLCRRAARRGEAARRRTLLGEGRQERACSCPPPRSWVVLVVDRARGADYGLWPVPGSAQDMECPSLGLLALRGRDSEGLRPGPSLPRSAVRELDAPGRRASSGERPEGQGARSGHPCHRTVRSWA